MRALGLVGLNLVALVDGIALLWAMRGFERRREILRLAGLAYLLGISALGVACTWLLVAGAPISVPIVAGTGAGILGLGLAAGRRLAGRRLPVRGSEAPAHEPLRVVGFGIAALTWLYLADFLRAARLQTQFSFEEWDVWSSWTTKAKLFYYFGGLDAHLYATTFMPGYPIFVPTLSAMSFSFMGAPDTTLLHVQYWLLLAGFVVAVAGLLRPDVPLALVWTPLLLLVLAPQLNRLAIAPQADFVLDELFAAAGLCVALWILRREAWLLAAASVLLAAAMSTKREGYLFSAALIVAAAAVTLRSARSAWPRLAAAALPAFLATLPWQLWRRSHHLPDSLQGTSWSEVGHRIGPAASSVAQIMLGTHFWLVATPIGIAAAAAALVLADRDRGPSILLLVTLALGYAGMVWALTVGTAYTLGPFSDQNPIPRASGALVLLSVALTPLLLRQAAVSQHLPRLALLRRQRAAASAERP
jgi:hypothetical protein